MVTRKVFMGGFLPWRAVDGSVLCVVVPNGLEELLPGDRRL
jgi:hypothetical protein